MLQWSENVFQDNFFDLTVLFVEGIYEFVQSKFLLRHKILLEAFQGNADIKSRNFPFYKVSYIFLDGSFFYC